MKKLISFLLILTVLLTAIPATRADAAVKISKAKASLEVDATLQLKLTGSSSAVKWSTSKKAVSTVSKDGLVTAMAEGQTTITATVSKKKYSCIISVVDTSQDELTAEKGTVTELTTGIYVIGEDFPAGKYNIKALSGSGNFFVESSEDYVNEILAEKGNETFDTHTYSNLKLYYGDEMKITSGVILEFTKLD